MPLAYPLGLRTILRQSKSRTQPAAFSASDPARGSPYFHPTGTDTPVIWDCAFRFTREEAVQFRLWFTDTLQRGALWFEMPIKTEFGTIDYLCHFLPDGLLPTREDGELWEYSASIVARSEIIPQSVVDSYSVSWSAVPDQSGQEGGSLSIDLTAYVVGGVGPYIFALEDGALPGGITLTEGGLLSGTYAADGTFSASFRVTAAVGGSAISNDVQFTVADVDPFFADVVLLLKFEGANLSSSITDSSSYADHKTAGVQYISTTDSWSGSSSLRIDETAPAGIQWTGSRFARTAAEPFTIEGCFRIVTGFGGTAAPPLFRLRNNTGNDMIAVDKYTADGRISFKFGSDAAFQLTATPDADGWVHWEIGVEADNTLHIFLQGTEEHTGTFTATSAGSSCDCFVAGGTTSGSFNSMQALVDNYRFTMGACRHTTDFTPPADLPTA